MAFESRSHSELLNLGTCLLVDSCSKYVLCRVATAFHREPCALISWISSLNLNRGILFMCLAVFFLVDLTDSGSWEVTWAYHTLDFKMDPLRD